jgi:hypothetical protein
MAALFFLLSARWLQRDWEEGTAPSR